MWQIKLIIVGAPVRSAWAIARQTVDYCKQPIFINIDGADKYSSPDDLLQPQVKDFGHSRVAVSAKIDRSN